jgi:hypothetical protein
MPRGWSYDTYIYSVLRHSFVEGRLAMSVGTVLVLYYACFQARVGGYNAFGKRL